jgi:hypothetical protein
MIGLFKRFGERFRTFDLLPEYFRSVAAHWQDFLWGESIVAVAFTMWWLLGNPPAWAISVYLVSAMFVAGYYLWRRDHVRLMPKLELGDIRVVKTPTRETVGPVTRPGADRVVAQLEVKNTTEVIVDDSRGYLVRVWRWSDTGWISTEVDEPLELLWSTIDEPSRALYPGIPQRLCIFAIDDVADRYVYPWAKALQLRMLDVFKQAGPATFKFDISVRARDCLPIDIALRVQMGETWDAPVVELIR